MKKFSLIIVLIITLSLIAVAESKKIKGGEYFFDNDPGIGNGYRFNLSAIDTLEILDSISTSNLSYGIHTLCLRYLDEDDNWGYTLCNLIHIISKENESEERDYSFPISAYEFFFDDGVAPGKGTLKSITRKDTVEFIDSVSVSNLSYGIHNISIRFRDTVNNWGFLASKLIQIISDTIPVVSIPSSKNIKGFEIYHDNDQGIGNGVKYEFGSMTKDTTFVDSVSMSGLSHGMHTFSIRFFDEDNNYGFLESKYDMIIETQKPVVNLQSSLPLNYLEYFIDNDPGVGSGHSISINKCDTLETQFKINVGELSDGNHSITVRFADSLVHWGFNSTNNFSVMNVLELINPSYDTIKVALNPLFMWSKSSEAINYQIQLSKDSLFSQMIFNKFITDTSYFFDSDTLEFNKLYYWRARFIREVNDTSEWSGIGRFRTKKNFKLPELYAPADKSTEVNTHVNFVWLKSDSAINYKLQLSKYDNFSVLRLDSMITDTTFLVLNLSNYQDYFWRLKAYSQSQESDWSDIWTFKTGMSSEMPAVSKLVKVKIALNGLWSNYQHKPAEVSIELRTGNELIGSTVSDRIATLVDSEGNAQADFGELPDGNYWLVVRSSGYLPVAVPQKIQLSKNGINYDFTTGSDKSVSGNEAMIQVNGSGPWILRAGDFNNSGSITAGDANIYLQNQNKNVSFTIPEP